MLFFSSFDPVSVWAPTRNTYLQSTFNNSLADSAGLFFIHLAVVASQTCQLVQNSEEIWTYSSSRSSKVDDFGTNRKRICEFLY